MYFAILEPDGRLLDEIFIENGKARMAKDDAIRVDRRNAYHQQAHVALALSEEKIERKGKTMSKIKLHNGIEFEEVEIDTEGRPTVVVCGRFPIVDTVRILQNEEGRCSVASVRRCGSVWSCPVCGRKVLRGRADEIRKAVEHFKGTKKFMVTLTASHSVDTELETFIKAFRNARRRMARNRKFIAFRKQCGGYITAAEITWSKRNGWHWHVHELWLDCPYPPDFGWLWMEELENVGMHCSAEHGYDVTESWDASEYIAKWDKQEDFVRRWDTAKETASWKKGRSVWDMSPTRYDLVREHYHATKGMRRISWSKGLKAEVGVKEANDNELADADQGTEIMTIPQWVWTQVHGRGLIPDVLECAEQGGSNLVLDTIMSWIEGKWSFQAIDAARRVRAAFGEINDAMETENA